MSDEAKKLSEEYKGDLVITYEVDHRLALADNAQYQMLHQALREGYELNDVIQTPSPNGAIVTTVLRRFGHSAYKFFDRIPEPPRPPSR